MPDYEIVMSNFLMMFLQSYCQIFIFLISLTFLRKQQISSGSKQLGIFESTMGINYIKQLQLQLILLNYIIYFASQILMIHNLPKLPQDQTLSISSKGLDYIINNFDQENPQRNFLWTTDYRTELPVRVKKSGPGSQNPYTFPEMWRQSVKEFGNHSALNWEASPNKWKTWTYTQYYNQCLNFAKSVIALQIQQYTAINIIGFNSPQWAVAFSGSILGNYLPIGIYTTNGPDACQYIANHSQCQLVVLEDRSHLKKYITNKNKVQGIKYYVLYKDTIPEDLDGDFVGRVFTWDQFMKLGTEKYSPKRKQDQIEERMNAAKPGNCCTFIYTSGTTGPPKAVMVSHDNYTWTVDAVGERFKFGSPEQRGNGRFLSLLPLSHVAAQFVDLVLPIRFGYSIFFTDTTALQGNLVKFLQIAKPTFFLCVPRVWEKMEEKIAALGAQTTGFKRKIADWAKDKSPIGTHAQLTGKPTPHMWSVAKKLVFDKIKQNLGLDQCKIFMFSAAPLKQSTRQFFLKINIYLHNIYGMSQLSGPQTFSDPNAWTDFLSKDSMRDAGICIPGLELKIDNPDADGNGQICLRGRNTFMGYFKNEKETLSVMDQKGFVHSGDIGMIHNNGSLIITGRIKQLLITAGGQNVAPVLIENQIHTALPIFSTAVVIGDKRKYLTVLLCLKLKDLHSLTDQVIDYIKPKGSDAKTIQQAVKCLKLRKIIQQGIQRANEKAISRAQRVINFKILPAQFTIDSGLLTPTLKLKRKIINERFTAEIEQMYIEAKL